MPAVFHPCQFQFRDVDARIVGTVVDGGTSLSGYTDRIETDGGGSWRVDLTNGSTRDRDAGLAWRALTAAMDGGAQAVVVLLCAERHYQPILGRVSPPGTPLNTILSDDAPDKGAAYTASAAAPLRSTSLSLAGTSELALSAGALFSVNHPTWGWRTYRIIAVDDGKVTFRPPLREAIPAGTVLEFDIPRCQMRLAQATSNATNIGRFTSCSAVFVEDMRKPAS